MPDVDKSGWVRRQLQGGCIRRCAARNVGDGGVLGLEPGVAVMLFQA